MLRGSIVRGGALLAGFLPFNYENYDTVSKDSKTYQKYLEERKIFEDNETGSDRVKRMFKQDECGKISNELNSVIQAGTLGVFTGVLYGGFIHSRIAYMNFMENNQATAFASHLDAKKKLQDSFTLSFAKGAWKWGWRMGLFTTGYCGITTIISVYRGKSSLIEYLSAGTLTGAMYKVNLGLRGIAVGGIVGGVLGGVAGGISLLLLKISGQTMEDVRYWQYKWQHSRDSTANEAMKKNTMFERSAIMDEHDEKSKSSSLEVLEAKSNDVKKNPS